MEGLAERFEKEHTDFPPQAEHRQGLRMLERFVIPKLGNHLLPGVKKGHRRVSSVPTLTVGTRF